MIEITKRYVCDKCKKEVTENEIRTVEIKVQKPMKHSEIHLIRSDFCTNCYPYLSEKVLEILDEVKSNGTFD